jgi:hypothetical protein
VFDRREMLIFVQVQAETNRTDLLMIMAPSLCIFCLINITDACLIELSW